jgi:DNA invertase Pin-like site-specific DNA recombinase
MLAPVTHVAVYLRQSFDRNDDQLAVGRQREDCEALCAQRGWTWTEYEDNDYSATNGKPRPAYMRMLADIRAGAVNGIVAWHVDRLYRQPRDLEDLIDLANARNLALATVSGDIDLSTDMGRLVARLVGATNKAEVERKSARQKRANQQARAAGKWNRTGVRRFGYDREGRALEPEASLLRQAATDVLAGKSLRSIATAWDAQGLRTVNGSKWTTLQLRRMLLNPLYAGLMTYQGRVVGAGKWEPVLAKDIHDGLVAFLSDPSRRPAVSFERRHMLSTVARCGQCGAPLYAVYPGGRGRGATYACRPAAHVARSAAALDEYVEALVLAWFSQPETRKRLAALLNGGRKVDVPALRAQHEALQARKRQLATQFAKGVIDADQLESGTGELNAQQAAINQVLGGMSRRSPAAGMLAADDPREYWGACSPDIRSKIVDDVMTVTVLPAPRGPWFHDRSLPTEKEWKRFAAHLDIKPKGGERHG